MTAHIDIQRRFYQLSENDLKDAELYATYPDLGFRTGLSWEDLTAESRVLILAEGGSGKTREMERQAQLLSESGKSAFFLPLESLSLVTADSLLYRDPKFSAWKVGTSPGWFFLDSVDELKLTALKFAHALKMFAAALGPSVTRARIIISSRPHDWQASLDLNHFRNALPLPPPLPPEVSESADEIFRAALQRNDHPRPKEKPQSEFKGPPGFRVVMLAPLSNAQIRMFASASGVIHTESFVQELERENVWQFARRPLDLGNLLNIWKSSGSFGTRTSQHEANVVHKLREDPDRADAGQLPDNKAREGIEKLALAMLLARRKHLHSYESAVFETQEADDLDPGSILDRWSPAERKALLGRAIFQPSVYGRVRFHHRSVHEYLAACCLHHLGEKGMGVKALFRLLFAEIYGTKVVIPSMRPVAAWLALWNPRVRAEILLRQPELLLQEGDPGSLDPSTKRELLSAYVNSYGTGGWRGLSVSHDEIRRLSSVDLGPEISRIWNGGIENDEVKDLLISLVESGRIASCSSIAAGVIHDPRSSDHLKAGALQALIACADQTELAALGAAIESNPTTWSAGFLRHAILSLFPEFLPASCLIDLTERFGRRRARYSSDGWAFLHRLQSVELAESSARDLMRGLGDLIVRHAKRPLQSYRLKTDFSHLNGVLAYLCLDQMRSGSHSKAVEAIRFLVIAARFRDQTSSDGEDLVKACDLIRKSQSLRRIAFESDFAFITSLFPEENPRRLVLVHLHNTLVGDLAASDAPWLDELMQSAADTKLKEITYEILLRLWHAGGTDQTRLGVLRSLAQGHGELESLLASYEFPAPLDPAIVKMNRENERYRRKDDAKEAKRLQNWETWREGVLADPADAFVGPKINNTIENLHSWLMGRSRSSGYCEIWDAPAIVAVFGDEFFNRAKEAFQNWWRSSNPRLPSQKGVKLKNKTPYVWLYGLTGVESEALLPNWSEELSDGEAVLAITYATVQINGLAPFAVDLARSHPEPVERTLRTELENEFTNVGSENHLQVLQDLTHADPDLQRLMTPCLVQSLLAIDGPAHARSNQIAHNLDQIFQILGITADLEQRSLIGDKCHAEYLREPSARTASAWLGGLLTFAPHLALPILEGDLVSGDEGARAHATKRLAELFGDRGGRLPIPDDDERARTLGRLIRFAFDLELTDEEPTLHNLENNHEEDQPRRTVHTARGNLLSALLEISGRTAQEVVTGLATNPKLADQADRLVYLSREKAAKDSEPPASAPEEIQIMLRRDELPPEDQAGLFRVMRDRLDDIAHDIAHHNFSDRATLRTIVDEVEMQRVLALRLESIARDCYTITRESEMADLKKNDIQLSILRKNAHVVIEIKLADNNGWSATDFKRFLVTQLRGQYLRHKNCTAGCLLLVYRGEKGFWTHPESNVRMGFKELIAFLNECAEVEVRENNVSPSLQIVVEGLDLTDPPLDSPHRIGKTRAKPRKEAKKRRSGKMRLGSEPP
ncbi:MAG: hypothetical protein EOP84_00555 [Verrucomicrobiaceae bacterium]|nr:MAG: hypothetical protein EOP84_00555 [Verrucomicrobiaceae bacterium]